MKKTKSAVSAAILAFSSIVASCYTILPEMHDASQESTGTAMLNLRITGNGVTRSSISPDEDFIEDICVMAYSREDGRLASMQTGSSPEDIGLELKQGTYNIYVTANMGTFDAPADESEIGNALHAIDSFEDMGNALPMCWKGKAELQAGENSTVYASLSRLVSKVSFKVETGVLEGLEITSVRLCQGAGHIRPFMEGGSRILSEDEALDGDYATDEDIRSLMDGYPMYFYATENCQGALLADNDDPWTKVPDSIGDKAGLCTYLEMKGKWSDAADYEGTVTYRFYLGEDATGNFDIRRNSLHDLTLYLDEESFDRISWKIDTSQMEPSVWEVWADLDDNFHSNGEFYVTENICITFGFDERGKKYWDRRDNAFTLAGLDFNGNEIIRFNSLTDLGDGRFSASGSCIKAGSCDIVMINTENGRIECCLTKSRVSAPGIVAGQKGTYTSDTVEGFEEETEFMVNGWSHEICLYLTDSKGYNLNQRHFYGCDFSICNWDIDILNTVTGESLSDMVNIECFPGQTGSDSYAVRYRLSFLNDGKDSSWNRRLTESLGQSMLAFRWKENTSGTEGEHWMGLYCYEIDITLKPVPDNQKFMMGTEFMYAVDNPSNLPVRIRGLKMNSMTGVPSRPDVRPVICNPISGHTGKDPLLISAMPYTLCSLEEGSAFSVVIDGQRCYAADDNGIWQEEVPAQKAMFHTFEAELAYGSGSWTPEFIWKTDLYDSEAHKSIYGKDGFMNCGTILHAYGGTSNAFDGNNGISTDFTGYGAMLDEESVGRFHETVIVDFSINDKNEITATASREVDLHISVSGSLKGHIRCATIQDPFFTVWGHYFTHSQDFSSSRTVKLGTSPVAIDGSVLADSFEDMRAIEYYSTYDAWDIEDFRDPTRKLIIREYLKPYDIDLDINITSPDGIPVAVRFSGSAKYDYRISDPVTWPSGLLSYVTMVPSSYSGFDDRLDDDDCPAGALFKAEFLYLQPNVTFGNTRKIYYMSR